MRTFSGKTPDPNSGTYVSFEHALSKRACTFHKSPFVWKSIGKIPHTQPTTSIKHRAITLTVRTPQCGHTVWGKKGTLTYQQKLYSLHIIIAIYIPYSIYQNRFRRTCAGHLSIALQQCEFLAGFPSTQWHLCSRGTHLGWATGV